MWHSGWGKTIGSKIRSVIDRSWEEWREGIDDKGVKGTICENGNVLYLDFSGDNTPVCICQHSLNCILVYFTTVYLWLLLYGIYISINLTLESKKTVAWDYQDFLKEKNLWSVQEMSNAPGNTLLRDWLIKTDIDTPPKQVLREFRGQRNIHPGHKDIYHGRDCI